MINRDRLPHNASTKGPEHKLMQAIFGRKEGEPTDAERALRSLLECDVIPATRIYPNFPESLEAMGFELAETVPGDPIFRFAKIPEGWTKREEKHPHQTTDSAGIHLIDTKGRVRARIYFRNYYLASVRYVQMQIYTYYFIARRKEGDNGFVYQARNRKGDVLFESEPEYLTIEKIAELAGSNQKGPAEMSVIRWLWNRFHNWSCPALYWDDEEPEEADSPDRT